MRVEEVSQELGISKFHAYKVIHKRNTKLRDKGYLTITGLVNRNFFMERFFCGRRERGLIMAVYCYTDWNGERKQTQKCGFKTKREAQDWEREQLNKTSADLNVTLELYAQRIILRADIMAAVVDHIQAAYSEKYDSVMMFNSKRMIVNKRRNTNTLSGSDNFASVNIGRS